MALTRKQLRIAAAKALGAYITSNLDTDVSNASATISVPGLIDTAFDDERYESWYVQFEADPNNWRLVKSTTIATNGDLLLTRNPTNNIDAVAPGGTQSAVCHFYAFLSPDDWNTAIDQAMQDKFTRSRIVIPLSTDPTVREYNLTVHASWLTSKGQVLRVRVRDDADGSSTALEDEEAYVALVEDEGQVVLYLPAGTQTRYNKLIVEARKYFGTASDDDTLYAGISDRLAVSAAKYEALKLIFQKCGPGAKRWFGTAMKLAIDELTEQELRHQDNEVYRDWSSDELPVGGAQGYDAYGGW